MIIRNKYLNISSKDILNEKDLTKLKQYLVDIEENILCMVMSITQAKLNLYENGIRADQEWFNKITTACRLQKILKIQLENHINSLENKDKKLLELLRTKFSQEEWDNFLNQIEEKNPHDYYED